jgi:hypothetical protein
MISTLPVVPPAIAIYGGRLSIIKRKNYDTERLAIFNIYQDNQFFDNIGKIDFLSTASLITLEGREIENPEYETLPFLFWEKSTGDCYLCLDGLSGFGNNNLCVRPRDPKDNGSCANDKLWTFSEFRHHEAEICPPGFKVLLKQNQKQ